METNRDVGLHALVILALRHDDDTVPDGPGKDDLRGRRVKPLRDGRDDVVRHERRRLAVLWLA
jgi:hypothetical protein